jgi:uncharacterized protein (DUF1499 family)
MRRQLPTEPMSRAAVWSRRLAVFAATVAILSVALARLQKIDPIAALAVLGAAVAIALLALLMVAAAASIIWRRGRRGVGEAVWGALIALLTLAYPAFLAVEAMRLPVLADVATDIVDPPQFSLSSAATRARAGYNPPSLAPERRQVQRAAYPDVEPVVVDLDQDEAFALVLKTAAARGWRVVDQRPAGGRSAEGHIDFFDRTLVMGFDEDITVRLRPLSGQTRIDLRAASRYGRHDFGANAKRITRFAEELQSQLDTK